MCCGDAAPSAEDFDFVREHLRLMERIHARHEARAQAIGFDEGAVMMARRRHLVGELLEWLEARQELAELARLSGAPPAVVA